MATVFHDRSELQRRVRHPLQALRGYIRRYVTLEGVGVALLYLALWFWVGLILDFGSYWVFGFDWIKELGKLAQGKSTDLVLRGILLGVLIAGVVALVVWKIVLRLTREFNDPALAMVLERRYPRELGDRLITAVELADPRMSGKYGYSQDLVDKTVNEAADRVESLPVRNVFDWTRLGRLGLLVGGLPVGLYLLMGVGHLAWGALSEQSATPSGFVHRFNGVTATWLERNILLRNTEWPPTGYLEVVRFQDTPDHPGEMRLGLEAQRPDIQVRAVQWILFDAEEEAWRPLRWRDLPGLLKGDLPRVDLPAHWPGWVIDLDDLDARVSKELLPEDLTGKTSGEIRKLLIERQRFLERAGVMGHIEDLLNWQTWSLDRIAVQINEAGKGDVRRTLREQHPEALAGIEDAFTKLNELVDSGRAYRRLRKLEIPDRVYATFYHRDFKNPDRDKSRRTQTYGDWQEDRGNKYVLSLSELKESVEFTARAGTYVTDAKQITFFPAPAITTLTAHKEEPAYLYYRLKGDQTPLKGLKQQVDWPAPVEGEETVFAVPFGTTLTLAGQMDRDLKTIRVAPPPSDRKGIVPETDVDFDAKAGKAFQLELGRMVKAHDFVLEYLDRDGIDGRRRIKIDVADDAAPRVENLDLAVVLRHPKDKSGNKLPIRLPGGKVTSNVYVITRHALVPWKGKLSDDIGLTHAQWDHTVQQVQVELIGGKEKDQPITPAQLIPYARVVSGLQFGPGPILAYAPRHWLMVTQLVESDLAALTVPKKSWAGAVPLEILQERLAEFDDKLLTIEQVRTRLKTSATPVKFLREHDLHREEGFDFPKFLPMTQPPDPEKEGQYKFIVKVTVSAQDNNVETGPVTGRFAKEPYQFLIVTDNEFLNEIFKEEELLREKLAKVSTKLKAAKVLVGEQVAQLTIKEPDLDLVRIRCDETRRMVSDTATVTREVKDDYARIVRELEVNIDRGAKKGRRGQVEEKLNVTTEKISRPLEFLFKTPGPYPASEESIQALYEALDRDAGAKGASINRDAHIKMARLCQENLDWLLEDIHRILNAMEEGIEWGKVLEFAINLERTQRQIGEQFQLWHSERVTEILQGILNRDKGPEKK